MREFIPPSEDFPYPQYLVSGYDALAAWEDLKLEHKDCTPVILGSYQTIAPLRGDPFFRKKHQIEKQLKQAEALDFPAGYLQHLDEQYAKFLKKYGKRLGVANFDPDDPSDEDLLGSWPDEPLPQETDDLKNVTVVYDIATQAIRTEIPIVLLPTPDWTEAPIYLGWGGWNACPSPQWHVAAFRRWKERYGAELVGLSSDTLNMRVQNRPTTREEAIDLAWEQYRYCEDIVSQGVGDISTLAADLISSNWWYFWWD